MKNGMFIKVFDIDRLNDGISQFKMKYAKNPKLYMSKETSELIWNNNDIEFVEFIDDNKTNAKGIVGEYIGYEIIEEPLRFGIVDLR